MMPLLVALYIRVSTADQNADLQERELREYAAARGFVVAAVYSEVASGADSARPRLTELMRDARMKKFAAVLVWKLDRFGRSLVDCIQSVRQLDDFGVRFVCVTQGIDTDKKSPQGTFVLQMFAVFAEFEQAIIRERASAGRKRYLADLAAGRVGKTVQSRSGKNLPLGRPRAVFDRAAVIRLREEKDDYGDPLSIRAIAERLSISRTTVERVLKGTSRGKGATCPG